MIAWQRSSEPFCAYCHRRRDQRRRWIMLLYASAANEYSRALAAKLARQWGIE